jgi:hypothetical protein
MYEGGTMFKVGTRNVDYTFNEDGEILVMNWDTDQWEEKEDLIEWAVEELKGTDGFPDEPMVEGIEVDFSGNVWLYMEGGE